jgi:DNA-binding XRE family transcriptional regulator
LSQEALARAVNLSTASIYKIERAWVDPSWSVVQALAKALGVDCTAFQADNPDGIAGGAGAEELPPEQKPKDRKPRRPRGG